MSKLDIESLPRELRQLIASNVARGDSVTLLAEKEAVDTQSFWEDNDGECALDGLVVVGESLNGDIWVVDPTRDFAIGVVSHGLVWEGGVTSMRDAMIVVCGSVRDMLTELESKSLPIDYWDAKETI